MDNKEINIELNDEPEIEIKPVKKKRGRGRPKGSTNKKKRQKEPEPEPEPELDSESEYITNDGGQDIYEMQEKFLEQVDYYDNRTELKKLYLNNKKILEHLTIKKIDKLKEYDVEAELDMCRMLVNNQITKTLSNQILSVFNGGVGWLFGLGNDFNDYVMTDDMLKNTTNNILCDDLLGHINHRLQFLILYGSKIVEHNNNKQKRLHSAILQQKLKHIEKMNTTEFVPEIVKEQRELEKINEGV